MYTLINVMFCINLILYMTVWPSLIVFNILNNTLDTLKQATQAKISM